MDYYMFSRIKHLLNGDIFGEFKEGILLQYLFYLCIVFQQKDLLIRMKR